MICAWKEFLDIIPGWLKGDVDKVAKDTLLELRLRCGAQPELITNNGVSRLSRTVCREDLEYCVNLASRYSPWSSATIASGYITAPGGHRIGLCGDAVMKDGVFAGIRKMSSICIRVARDYTGISERAGPSRGSAVILGAPGWGKTTLLRDYARRVAQNETVCVVDERGELFPDCFSAGRRMDIMCGVLKSQGIEILLRTMGPTYIAMDEITAESDCAAVVHASYCGVKILATAHAGSLGEFKSRPVYSKLIQQHIFTTALVLRPDRTYSVERLF